MKKLFQLSWPVSLMYLGLILMGFVDLVVVGRLGASEVAGLGVGNSIFSWILVPGFGLLTGMDYPMAHAMGAGKKELAQKNFIQGLYLSIGLGGFFTLFAYILSTQLHRFGLNPEILPFAQSYLAVVSVGFLFSFGFAVCRSYLQVHLVTLPLVWILIAGNILNLILDLGFVLGYFGFPQLGFIGAAYATVIGRVMTFLLGFWVVLRVDFKTDQFFKKLGWKLNIELWKPILKLGTPSAFQMLFEMGAFSLTTILAAHFSPAWAAAHQIVLMTASTTFMVALGISNAASVLVGRAMGAQELDQVKKSGFQALGLGSLFMGCMAVIFLSFPETILRIYTDDLQVIENAKILLVLAGFFQLADGAQVVMTGALRGIGNTRIPALGNLFGHWLIGLPIGLYLGFVQGQEVYGIWKGLTTGIVVVACFLIFSWHKKTKELIPLKLA